MTNNVKFHSPEGPAFNVGEKWIDSGGHAAFIQRTYRYGDNKWDVEVTAEDAFGKMVCQKDAWHFQVRYTHSADIQT